jgi:hypothetical protein
MNPADQDCLPAIDDIIVKLISHFFNAGTLPDRVALPEREWEVFLSKAGDEGVSGLLFHCLSSYAKDTVPAEVYRRLEREYLTGAGRNIFIAAQLKELFRRFQSRRLPVLIMRGAVFFKQLYPSPGIRPMADVDIVIDKENCSAMKTLLEESGYRHPPGYPFLFHNNSVYLDLHLNTTGLWRVKSWPSTFNIKDEEIWGKTKAVDDIFPLVRTLGIYDSVLACCEHLQRHSFRRLIWFVDIARLIRKEGINFDWNMLLRRAERFNLKKPLFFVVKYLDRVGFIALPDEALSYLRRVSMNRFEKKSLTMLLNNQRAAISGELLFLFSVVGIKRRIRLIREILFMEKERLPLAGINIGIKEYVRRAGRIVTYIFMKALSVLRPVKKKIWTDD